MMAGRGARTGVTSKRRETWADPRSRLAAGGTYPVPGAARLVCIEAGGSVTALLHPLGGCCSRAAHVASWPGRLDRPVDYSGGKQQVNKTEFIDALAERFDGNRKEAEKALESVLDTITREVVNGEKVAITGFGSFEKRIREARWVRNPQTGERIKAKKKTVPRFKAGQQFKDATSGAKKLAPAPKASKRAAKKPTGR